MFSKAESVEYVESLLGWHRCCEHHVTLSAGRQPASQLAQGADPCSAILLLSLCFLFGVTSRARCALG